MPIFFHCSRIISAICVNWTNWPPSVMISMRSRPLPSRAQAVALGVLLGQPDLVQHLVGLLHVERGPHLPVLRARVVLVAVRGHDRARRARAQPERLVDLVAVDAERQRAAEVGRVQPLGDLGVGVVVQVELDDHVAAVVAGVEIDLVVALLLVLEEHRQLAEVDVALPGSRTRRRWRAGSAPRGSRPGSARPCRCRAAGCPPCPRRRCTGCAPASRSAC